MKYLALILATTALSACVFSDAGADSLVPAVDRQMELSDFDSIELLGGGDITIRYDSEYSFTNTGSPEVWKLTLEKGNLVLGCPKDQCKGRITRTAVITLPRLENLSLKGGGDITVEGDFPASDSLNISLFGGGDIDAYAIDAEDVNISIKGGGDISVSASDNLNISILGGGDISYRGSPRVSKSIIGGGDVHKAG